MVAWRGEGDGRKTFPASSRSRPASPARGPSGTKSETPSQTIGAFLMMHGLAPWEAEELLRWLDLDGFEIVRKRTK